MKNNSVFPVLVSLLVSFAIALFAYFLLIYCVVDTDLHTSHREIALLDFYQNPHTNDIFILGSSYVTEGIDGYLVEDTLRERGINRSVYDLGIQAETPLSRLPELKNLIASKPGMVVIGLGFRDLTNRTDIYDDRFALISQRVQLDESYRPLFNDTRLQLLTQSPLENLLYKRKFIGGSTAHLISNGILKKPVSGREALYETNFKDPWVLTINLTNDIKMQKAHEEVVRDEIDENPNPQKLALLYTIDRLRNDNISVIIISMPMVSYYSDGISASSRQNFSAFLNATGVPWYDFQRAYPPPFFVDVDHMNTEGRTQFSGKLASIIADNIRKGA